MSADVYEYSPKVSIVIPAYNASNYLAEAIESAMGQTYQNIEIIVVNDGSKDDGATDKLARSYGDKIIYISKENGGSSSALNAGIQAMSGEWFSWLSHDDLYYPQKLERQIAYLNSLATNHTAIENNVVFAAAEAIDKNGIVIRKCRMRRARKKAAFLERTTDNSHLICKPTEFVFHGCSGLLHKSVFEGVGMFDESLRLLNDYDMWFRIYSHGYRIHYLPEVLVQGRVHAKQVSRSIGFSYHNSEQDMYWQRSLDWLKAYCANDASLFAKYGSNAYLKTRTKEGEEAFAYAKKIDPASAPMLSLKKMYYVCYAKMRTWVKNVYIKLRMDN